MELPTIANLCTREKAHRFVNCFRIIMVYSSSQRPSYDIVIFVNEIQHRSILVVHYAHIIVKKNLLNNQKFYIFRSQKVSYNQ